MVWVRSENGVVVDWTSPPGAGRWWLWRWAQRYPEDIGFRDNPHHQHREARF